MSLVEDYMNTKMVTRGSSDTIYDISKAMSDWKISSIAITDEKGRQVMGILTERDVVKGIGTGIQPEKVIAGSIMSTPVFSIRNDSPIEEAARLMIKNKVRHLLVEDAFHGVVGIITTTDLAKYLKRRFEKDTEKSDTKQGNRLSNDELLTEVWELYF